MSDESQSELAMPNERLRQQKLAYDEALAYLRAEGELEDIATLEELLNDKHTVFKIADLESILHMNGESIRQRCIEGVNSDGVMGIPGAYMLGVRGAWQIPKRGVVVYLARRRRQIREAMQQRRTANQE